MKYKYCGEDNCFCIELLAYKLMPKDKLLMKGDIIEVPDDNLEVNRRMKNVAHFQEIKESKANKKENK